MIEVQLDVSGDDPETLKVVELVKTRKSETRVIGLILNWMLNP